MPKLYIANTVHDIPATELAWRLTTDAGTTIASCDSAGVLSGGGVYGAGAGLAVNSTNLDVQVDGSSIDIATNKVEVKAAGVVEAKLDLPTSNTLNAKRTAHYTYSFAVNGGVHAGIALTGAALPNNALVTAGRMRTKTALTGATNASLQLLGANDLVAATAVSGAPWTIGALAGLVPVESDATKWLLTTNGTTVPTLVGTVADFTAGIFEVWLDYVVLGQP